MPRCLRAPGFPGIIPFCCKGCIAAFKKDPAKYVGQLEEQGVELDAVCACGHLKGSEDCREACAAKKAACKACGAQKGSADCKQACAAPKKACEVKKAGKTAGCCPAK